MSSLHLLGLRAVLLRSVNKLRSFAVCKVLDCKSSETGC